MTSTLLSASLHLLSSCVLMPWGLLRRPSPDPREVARLAQTALRQPALRQWLLVIASESPRVRRALHVRAAGALQTQHGHEDTTEALKQLADATLLDAVTSTLFRQTGLEPLAPAHRTGRRARVRLGELAERLHALDTTLQAA